MNKKAILNEILYAIGLVVVLISIFYVARLVHQESIEYQTYKEFCSDKPTFCYCNFLQCEFKTSWSSENGFSNDTKELCDLAKQLNDTRTIFRVSCE